MTKFQGQSLHKGVAIASAAKLTLTYGVPAFSPERLQRIAQRHRAFGADSPEPEQVILVADSLPSGFALSVLGMEILGIALGETVNPSELYKIPSIAGLGPDFAASVQEEDIIIVDGDRGVVYAAPDAHTFTRYQTPTQSRPRIILDGAHIPARTVSDNRAVTVYGCVSKWDQIDAAIANGADGIAVSADSDLLGSSTNPLLADEQEAALVSMLDKTAGAPVLLAQTIDNLALTVLMRAAVHGEIHCCVKSIQELNDVTTRLAQIAEIFEEDDIPYKYPLLHYAYPIKNPAQNMQKNINGVWLQEPLSEIPRGKCTEAAAYAQWIEKSLILTLDNYWQIDFPLAMTSHTDSLIAPCDSIAVIKDAIRAW